MIGQLKVQPRFFMFSNTMLKVVLFANDSNTTILKSPMSFNNSCGYHLAYTNGGFYIFENTNNSKP